MIAIQRRSGLRHHVHKDGLATLCGRVLHRCKWSKIPRARKIDCLVCKRLKEAELRFKYNDRVFEVPEGVSVEVEVDDEHVDFNFVRGDQWGEHIPMFGGIDEEGESVETWAEVGIKELA